MHRAGSWFLCATPLSLSSSWYLFYTLSYFFFCYYFPVSAGCHYGSIILLAEQRLDE